MHAVILTIHLLLALALILVVLLQRSEGGGLGIGGGGGGGIMTSRGAATALSKVTWALGTAFVVTSLTLTILAARDAGVGSVMDALGVPTSETPSAPAAPGLGGDLLPALPQSTPQSTPQALPQSTPAVPTPDTGTVAPPAEAPAAEVPATGAPATDAPVTAPAPETAPQDGPAAPPPVQ